jgi:hypothetical protein
MLQVYPEVLSGMFGGRLSGVCQRVIRSLLGVRTPDKLLINYLGTSLGKPMDNPGRIMTHL